MSYSHFTNEAIKAKFGVQQKFVADLFADVPEREASDLLKTTLQENVLFAIEQDTEKARSEFIIAPIFSELRRQTNRQISIFSGVEFNVDRKLGLTGECDFLVSRSTYQSALEAPVMIAVEAKRQDFKKGYSQCIAEMIAARIFNERRGNNITTIYGCVTIGDGWRFLLLRGQAAEIDAAIYDVNHDLTKILGILYAMATGIGAEARTK